MTKETKQIAHAIAKEMLAISAVSICEWITEAKLLGEFPVTKRQLEKWRNEALIKMGQHYKSLSNTDEKLCSDGSRRGKKSYIYHRGRMNAFIDDL